MVAPVLVQRRWYCIGVPHHRNVSEGPSVYVIQLKKTVSKTLQFIFLKVKPFSCINLILHLFCMGVKRDLCQEVLTIRTLYGGSKRGTECVQSQTHVVRDWRLFVLSVEQLSLCRNIYSPFVHLASSAMHSNTVWDLKNQTWYVRFHWKAGLETWREDLNINCIMRAPQLLLFTCYRVSVRWTRNVAFVEKDTVCWSERLTGKKN